MVSAPFAAFLEAERHSLNQRVLEARRRFPEFDAQVFSRFLVSGADPLVAGAPPERANAVALAAFELALELTGMKLAASEQRVRLLLGAWRDVAMPLMPVTAQHPAQVLSMLSNAVLHLESQPGVQIERWLSELAALAPAIQTLPQLEAVGQIAAWRSGMAHFRVGAIEAASTLPERLACAAVGVGEGHSWSSVREQMLRTPWWSESGVPPSHREIGSFAGFGGAFMAPPVVRAHADGFLVQSGEKYFFLIADAFGAVLQPAARGEFESAYAARGTSQQAASWQSVLKLPVEGLTVCSNGHSLAITSPYTHAITLAPAA